MNSPDFFRDGFSDTAVIDTIYEGLEFPYDTN